MNLFLKFFPPPSYLTMPAVGVDISDRKMKYVELKKEGSALRLKSFGSKAIPEGVILKGEIKNKESLVGILKDLRNKVKNSNIIGSLPEEKAFLKFIDFPFVEDHLIGKTLETQLEGIVPLPFKDIIFDYDIIEKMPKENKIKLVVSAFPCALLEDYVDVFEKAGFFPLGFEIENQSLFKILVEKGREDAVMVIDFGKTRTGFLVGEEGFVKFGSTVNVAGEHIDKALSRSLNVSISEAEKIKKKIVIQKKDASGNLEKIMPIVSVIKDEAIRILDYWQTHAKDQGFKNEDISEIILCGGDANIPGLPEYLSFWLKKKVSIGNPWLNISSFDDYVPEMDSKKSLMYAAAVGMAFKSFNI